MPVLKTIYFDKSSFIPTRKPDENFINTNFTKSDFVLVGKCQKNGQDNISKTGWFWAKLIVKQGSAGILGAFYLINIKIRIDGSFYGTKLAAPEPPFTGQDSADDECEN